MGWDFGADAARRTGERRGGLLTRRTWPFVNLCDFHMVMSGLGVQGVVGAGLTKLVGCVSLAPATSSVQSPVL
eukprot:COSAG05_NODE_17_length_35518_cov_34.728084_32_plen_73_part_00